VLLLSLTLAVSAAWAAVGDGLVYVRDGSVWYQHAGVQTQLTDSAAPDFAPSLSPDGSTVVFRSSMRGDSTTSALWTADIATGALAQLTDDLAEDYDGDWSPDGTKIAFKSLSRGFSASESIWILDVGTSALTQVTDDSRDDSGPSWSPDGEHLAIRSIATPAGVNFTIWTVDVGTGVRTQVSDDVTSYYEPAWSPDGASILLDTGLGGGSNIWVLELATSTLTQATNTGGIDYGGAWSPDGSSIAFRSVSRAPSTTASIWSVDLSTELYTQLTDDGGQDTDPDWGETALPGISVAPPSESFPDTPVGGSSSSTLTITSTGTGALTVSDITSDNPAFVVAATPPPPFDLAAADPDLTQDVSVTFSPTVEGPQNGNITITHNGPGSPTVITATGTGDPATGVTVTVTVSDSMGRAGGVVAIPIDVTSLGSAGVIGVALDISYDATLLTPTTDGVNITAAALGDALADSALWSVVQNVATPGLLKVALAGDPDDGPTLAGVLVSVTFDIDAAAADGATSLISLSKAEFDEGRIPSTTTAGTFSVLTLMYGDVTGNGEVTPYDAGWVLEHVANELAGLPHEPFPIVTTAPVWAPFPVTVDVAHEVADVDDPDTTDSVRDITASDAALILQHSVQLITIFPVETPAAPVQTPVVVTYGLHARAASEKPGTVITVYLDVSAMPNARAGELVLDFDADLLRPVDVSLRNGDTRPGGQRPLLVRRESPGRIAVAFASARPIGGSDAALEVTFEATGSVQRMRHGTIRASHLRLNRALIETDFAFPFRIEPFANRLMANYPNPFNPETWIPFELSDAADVTVRIYGLDGGLVRALELGRRAVGEYVGRDDAAYWDGKNARGESVASGVYVYELTAGDYHAVRRMVVRK
jgi:hypothetical protein